MGNGRNDPHQDDLQQDAPALDHRCSPNLRCSHNRSKQMEDVNAKFKELYDRPRVLRDSSCHPGPVANSCKSGLRDLLEWVKSETSGYYKDTLPVCSYAAAARW